MASFDSKIERNDVEAEISHSWGNKRAGWITFPVIAGAMVFMGVGGTGWMVNLIVFLIEKFNVNRIDAAQIFNVVNGCIGLLPVLAAIIADSFVGCFWVTSISSFIALMGTLLLSLTTTLAPLRPDPCVNKSSSCATPSNLQFGVLYAGIALATLGASGMRLTAVTLGADQFETQQDESTFFNWIFCVEFGALIIGSTVVVYIEDSVSWGIGFWLCVAANVIGLAIFLLGSRFYRRSKPRRSPFLSLARVFVASIWKRKITVTSNSDDYYYGTRQKQFFNRAALKTEGDVKADGSIEKKWRLCTVGEVEDLKTLVSALPLWSTSIFLATPMAAQSSMTILQALATDRHLGSHFEIPPGSVLVLTTVAAALSLAIIEHFLCPMWQKLIGSAPSLLQRIGVGHVLNVLGMVISALVESHRLQSAHSNNRSMPAPMSVLWLFPQLVVVGVGEAFHLPTQVTFYYQMFPRKFSNSATIMVTAVAGIACYLSVGLVDLARRHTGWLPENLNDGRLALVYWTLAGVGAVNFGYYCTIARFYREGDGTDSEKSAKANVACNEQE
ncbi:hypothetical protein ACJRO7_022209 [Eucalyptus globulus]|uniref:Uncharacterized protein n=1 Tax=Eucalyptus globulus TaxID=34317 RepID=A0ABD3KTZ2_EUCGL